MQSALTIRKLAEWTARVTTSAIAPRCMTQAARTGADGRGMYSLLAGNDASTVGLRRRWFEFLS